jgi:pimeloyl-ACP methyl ester carboxylesterase
MVLRLLASLLLALSALAMPVAGAQARPTGGVRVVFVGGLGSSERINAATFGPLSNALIDQAGFAASDLLTFSYDPAGPSYLPSQTCQPLATSAEQVAGFVRQLRDSKQADGVVLVGHSMGGVVALEAASQMDDLTAPQAPFVRRVITIDSPLGGISRLQRLLNADLWLGACPPANDAVARSVDSTWPATLSGRVDRLLDRGVQVFAVANPEDLLLDTWMQQVPASKVNVNVSLSVVDEALSHAAILGLPSALSELVPMIGPSNAQV